MFDYIIKLIHFIVSFIKYAKKFLSHSRRNTLGGRELAENFHLGEKWIILKMAYNMVNVSIWSGEIRKKVFGGQFHEIVVFADVR